MNKNYMRACEGVKSFSHFPIHAVDGNNGVADADFDKLIHCQP